MPDLTTLKTWLEEAEMALHKLSTGAQVAQVGYGEMQAGFTRAQVPELKSYIADLKGQIAKAEGGAPRRRMMQVYF